jgi:transposase
MVRIREDEWLEELRRLSQRSDAGLTTREWSKKLGKNIDTIRKLLHQAAERGWLVVGQRSALAINGRPCTLVVYRIVNPKAR